MNVLRNSKPYLSWPPAFESVLRSEQAVLSAENGSFIGCSIRTSAIDCAGYVSAVEVRALYFGGHDNDVSGSGRKIECLESALVEIRSGKFGSISDLRTLRKRLALDHHPDLLPYHVRQQATSDMSRVNCEIDRAIQNVATKIS